MKLMGAHVLQKAMKKYGDARKPLTAWAAIVEEVRWRDLTEVRINFPSADGVKMDSGLVVTVFNIKGNEYRLLASIGYLLQVVEILEFLTHADYSKDQWKRRY